MKFVKLYSVCAVFASAAIAAETPSPALLVLNKADQALAIVDPASGKIVARVSVGEGSRSLLFSGKVVFQANVLRPENAIQNTLAIPAPSDRAFIAILPERHAPSGDHHSHLGTIITEALSDVLTRRDYRPPESVRKVLTAKRAHVSMPHAFTTSGSLAACPCLPQRPG
jgi:hypothetical protein